MEIIVTMRIEFVNPTQAGEPVDQDRLRELCGDVSQFSSARESFEAVLSKAGIDYDELSLVVPELQDMDVWILVIEHDHGSDASVHHSEVGAREWLFAFVDEWWIHELPDRVMPDDPEIAIYEYFDHTDEGYTLVPTIVTEGPRPRVTEHATHRRPPSPVGNPTDWSER